MSRACTGIAVTNWLNCTKESAKDVLRLCRTADDRIDSKRSEQISKHLYRMITGRTCQSWDGLRPEAEAVSCRYAILIYYASVTSKSKCPKSFCKRPHRWLVTLRGCEWIRPIFTPIYNTWFLGLIWISIPNGISIGLTVFAQHTRVTDRQTNHATCDICSNRPNLCEYAMRPNNLLDMQYRDTRDY